jgi:hypothetical protein
VGRREKFQKQKRKKTGCGVGENKVQKKKPKIRGKKKLGRGQRENKVAKKKLRSGLRKGKQKSQPGMAQG